MENLKELALRNNKGWYLGEQSIGEIILSNIDKLEETQLMLNNKGFFDITFTTYLGCIGFIFSDDKYFTADYSNFVEVIV